MPSPPLCLPRGFWGDWNSISISHLSYACYVHVRHIASPLKQSCSFCVFKKKIEVRRSPKTPFSKHPQSIWHILIPPVYSDGMRDRQIEHRARYENNRFDNPRPVFCSLRWQTSVAHTRTHAHTHTHTHTHAHTTGDTLLLIRPHSKQNGTAETTDSELKERSLLYVREFQWSFLARSQGTAAKLRLQSAPCLGRLTTSEALNEFS